MKTAKPPSQIKRFVRLFASHAPKITPASFFRHTLTFVKALLGTPSAKNKALLKVLEGLRASGALNP
jgi:hypothetical protein